MNFIFFPYYGFKTVPKIKKLAAPSYNPHQQLACGKINTLPAGNRPEITVTPNIIWIFYKWKVDMKSLKFETRLIVQIKCHLKHMHIADSLFAATRVHAND